MRLYGEWCTSHFVMGFTDMGCWSRSSWLTVLELPSFVPNITSILSTAIYCSSLVPDVQIASSVKICFFNVLAFPFFNVTRIWCCYGLLHLPCDKTATNASTCSGSGRYEPPFCSNVSFCAEGHLHDELFLISNTPSTAACCRDLQQKNRFP